MPNAPEALKTRSNKLMIRLLMVTRSGVRKAHSAQILSAAKIPTTGSCENSGMSKGLRLNIWMFDPCPNFLAKLQLPSKQRCSLSVYSKDHKLQLMYMFTLVAPPSQFQRRFTLASIGFTNSSRMWSLPSGCGRRVSFSGLGFWVLRCNLHPNHTSHLYKV